MAIRYEHVHRLELRKFFLNFVLAIYQLSATAITVYSSSSSFCCLPMHGTVVAVASVTDKLALVFPVMAQECTIL